MKSEYEKLEINTLALMQLGYRQLLGYSRYMIKRGEIMSVIRMRRIIQRPDGRFNLIKDTGKRSPVNIQTLGKYVQQNIPKIKTNGQIKHAKGSDRTLCGKNILPWTIVSEDYNCGVCRKKEDRILRTFQDNIFLTLNGFTYNMSSRNLKMITPRLNGSEYRVHKIHNGTFLTYLQLSEKYPHLTERKKSERRSKAVSNSDARPVDTNTGSALTN